MVMSIFSAREPSSRERLTLAQIRQRLYETLSDCKDMATQRAIYSINVAPTPMELWLLRSDMHLCIARVHSQAEADKRMNALLEVFEGWVPPDQLTRIRSRLSQVKD